MNENHLRMLAGPRWAQVLRQHVLPWLVTVGDMGDDVLEIGPGPGLTTDLLLTLTTRITAVEVDASLARQLARRLAGSNERTRLAHAGDQFVPVDPEARSHRVHGGRSGAR